MMRSGDDPYHLERFVEAQDPIYDRVVAELKTTFASHYTQQVSLAEALQLDAVAVYGKQATGAKFLIVPHKPG